MAIDLGEQLASHISLAKVDAVHPNTFTATVAVTAGRSRGMTVEARIRSIAKHDAAKTGMIFLPEIGDEVYLDWSYGKPPMVTDHAQDRTHPTEKQAEYQTKITPVRGFGGEDPAANATGRRSYRWGPGDLMPGDKVIAGRQGNFLGVLSGGVTKLVGGPLSQILLSKLGDLVRIMARNFEVISDFGTMRMLNRDGAASFEILGNASAKKSNSSKGTDYDYTFRLGGKSLFDLTLMKDKFQFRVEEDGQAFIKTPKSFHIDMGSPPDIKIRGDSRRRVAGNVSDVTDGDAMKVYRGTKTERMGRAVFVCSGPYNKAISGNETRTLLGAKKESIRGPSASLTETTGYGLNIGSGDYTLFIGDPTLASIPPVPLAAQLKLGSYDLKVTAGDIKGTIVTKGDVSFQTSLGSVSLKTLAGDATLSTKLGDATLSTLGGDATVSTKLGDATLSTELGGVNVKTKAGDIDISTLAGTVKIASTLTAMELGPAGITFSNQKGSFELFALLDELMTNLISAQTPGYGGPLSTVAQLTALQIKIKLLKGA